MKPYKVVLIILAILAIDQVSKIWVKTHMFLGQEHEIASWFIIHFTENRGMAFGMELPGGFLGKLFLSSFRLIAAGVGVWYIFKLVKEKAHWGFITACAMILAGAIGNMIDGTLYGVIFSDSEWKVAEMFPKGGGYAGLMQGQVVDMLYFPLYRGTVPNWFPFWKGESIEFFRPVFNIADSAITLGVALILIFQGVFFKEEKKKEEEENAKPVSEIDTQSTSATDTTEPAG